MDELAAYIIPILALALLSGGWVAVQLLARKMRTKNHIEHAGSCGNQCTCMGIDDTCENKSRSGHN